MATNEILLFPTPTDQVGFLLPIESSDTTWEFTSCGTTTTHSTMDSTYIQNSDFLYGHLPVAEFTNEQLAFCANDIATTFFSGKLLEFSLETTPLYPGALVLPASGNATTITFNVFDGLLNTSPNLNFNLYVTFTNGNAVKSITVNNVSNSSFTANLGLASNNQYLVYAIASTTVNDNVTRYAYTCSGLNFDLSGDLILSHLYNNYVIPRTFASLNASNFTYATDGTIGGTNCLYNLPGSVVSDAYNFYIPIGNAFLELPGTLTSDEQLPPPLLIYGVDHNATYNGVYYYGIYSTNVYSNNETSLNSVADAITALNTQGSAYVVTVGLLADIPSQVSAAANSAAATQATLTTLLNSISKYFK